MALVVTNPPKVEQKIADALGAFGVATVHEAQGGTGLLASYLRPIFPGAHVSGTAVTVSVPPGDNWTIHVAVEQCGEGDILVVAPTTACEAGYVGELLATALRARGVRGIVIDSGCRDVAELRDIAFPVWSRCVTAFRTVKQVLGDVNLPIVCGGQTVQPGDAIVADDDGVVVVRRTRAGEVLDAARAREDREAVSRKRYESGELSLDVHEMRAQLTQSGLVYLDATTTTEP